MLYCSIFNQHEPARIPLSPQHTPCARGCLPGEQVVIFLITGLTCPSLFTRYNNNDDYGIGPWGPLTAWVEPMVGQGFGVRGAACKEVCASCIGSVNHWETRRGGVSVI